MLAIGYLARERRVAGWGCLAAAVGAFALLVGILAALIGAWPVATGAFGVAALAGLAAGLLVFAGFVLPSASQREWKQRSAENAPEAQRLWSTGGAGLGLEDLEFVATWHPDEETRAVAGEAAAAIRARLWQQRADESRRAAEVFWWSVLEGQANRAGSRSATSRPAAGKRLADHYSTLGVSRQATSEEITRAYRLLIAQHHPDHGGDEEKAKRINEAYATLKDPEKRRHYDVLLRYGGLV